MGLKFLNKLVPIDHWRLLENIEGVLL